MAIEKISGNAEKRKQEADRENRLSISHWEGSLHTHTKTDITNPALPEEVAEHRKGSNCGYVPMEAMADYYSREMFNSFIAITNHSRDGSPKEAVRGITQWFEGMYLANSEWINKEFGKSSSELNEDEFAIIKERAGRLAEQLALYKDKRLQQVNLDIDQIKNKNIKIFKGVEANLMTDGDFDTDMVAAGEFDIVNCSIHSSIDEEAFIPVINDPGKYSDLTIKGIKNPRTNIICHIGRGLTEEIFTKLQWADIFEEARNNQVAVEINIQPLMDFIYKEMFNYDKFPKNTTGYVEYLKEQLPRLVPILEEKNIQAPLAENIAEGLKIAINTDEHKNGFIDTETTEEGTKYSFKERGIRFWRCMKAVE